MRAASKSLKRASCRSAISLRRALRLSWEADACDTDCATDPLTCISEDLYKRQADLLVSEGYAAAGYQFVNIGGPAHPYMYTVHGEDARAVIRKP